MAAVLQFTSLFVFLLHTKNCVFALDNSNIDNTNNTTLDDDLELIFVQTLWRHGDRTALADLFPIYEKDWLLGGGGFGELTPLGMAQINRLGALMRQRYITDQQFLGERYNKKEVYIRSTDVNRTIISAMSFAYGFYPPGDWNIQGTDYPKSASWQSPMTFIPIHVDQTDNCVTNGFCGTCSRYNKLEELMKKLPEWQNFENKYKPFLASVMKNYNFTSPTDAEFQFFPDSLKFIRQNFNETLYKTCPWYNEQFYEESQRYLGAAKRMTQGVFVNDSTLDGLNIGEEVKKVQGGALLNELYDRAIQKLNCSRSNCTGYLEELKFYAYSAHDQNLYIILVLFGIPEVIDSLDSWPEVSSSVLLEFYTSKNSSQDYFKIFYRKSDGFDLNPVTQLIDGCDGEELCPLSVFKTYAEKYQPLPDLETFCNQPPVSNSQKDYNNLLMLAGVIYHFYQLN